ncbi:MAG: hypothetical protein ACFB4I_21500 [Cyanophyceae cyanobacterium]
MIKTPLLDFERISRKFKRITGTKVNAKQLFCFCGLKRSGLHAVSFWLLGHKDHNAFINNKPLKRAGKGSPMSRTVPTSPLPVRVRVGDPIRVCKDYREKAAPLPDHVDLLIILFQSQHLWHLRANEPIVSGVEAKEIQCIFLLRDPFNWAASYMQKSQHPDDVNVWPGMWKAYAQEYLGITHYLPEKVLINYNQWFAERTYRQQISAELGLAFTDETVNMVTHHAGGSSFDRTSFNRGAQQMSVMNRWQHFRENHAYKEAFRKHPEIIDLSKQIFHLPPELAEFSRSLKR